MKKALILLVILASLVTAQTTTEQHDINVTVPPSFGIRMTRAASTPFAPYTVTFDYSTDPAAYRAAVTGAQTLQPTFTNVGNIEVLARAGSGYWYVYVQATPLSYSGPESGAGLSLSDITAVRDQGPISGLSSPPWLFARRYGRFNLRGRSISNWALSTTPIELGRSLVITQAGEIIFDGDIGADGWVSLGFNGLDYSLRVDGDEDPGTFQTLVTYSIVNP